MQFTLEQIAEICHETNRAYCAMLGDTSQTAWKDASEHLRQSVIDGVKYALVNPGAAPSANHENWRKFKLGQGWKFGPIKDSEKKEHPCLMPFKDLPISDQIKDILFQNVVRSFRNYVAK
jgi:hypothetical protein